MQARNPSVAARRKLAVAAGKRKATSRPPAPARSGGRLRRWAGWIIRALPGLLAGLILLSAVTFYLLVPKLPDSNALFAAARQARVTVLAADGSILDERGGEGGAHLRLGEISPWLPKAVLAIEDRRFYSHFGLDPIGMVRAALSNLRAGEYVAGGSTITQQLAKNLFLGDERTLLRKLRELYLALWLEARLSKDEILELYLNRVYFGAGAWGAEAAARTYFSKPAHALTLAESAMLAGLLKAPSRYAPTRDPAAARARATVVLRAMVDAGYIDAETAEQAIASPARLAPAGAGFASHFVDQVLDDLNGQFGKPEDDRVVRTTLDPQIQRLAVRAVRERLAALPEVQAAVVVLDTDGAVVALVGGRDGRSYRLNRATELHRQPASVFKTFVYAAALARGRTPEDVVEDRPFAIGGWSPRNVDGRFHGPVTLEQAFAQSLNTVAVRLAWEIGTGRVIQLARRLGIRSELRPVPSLALGTSEVTLLELARAYLPFVTGGIARPDHLVLRVQNAAGRVLYRHRPTEARVLDAEVVANMRRLLRAVVERGTGRDAGIPDRHIFGKTGTSQGGRDGWFVGSDGRYLVAVWIGRDDNRPVPGLTGGGLPALVARDIFRGLPATVASAVRPLPRPRTDGRGRGGIESVLDWLRHSFGG